jgi:hypothetical protein
MQKGARQPQQTGLLSVLLFKEPGEGIEMAYDPNDPEDKRIVQELIDAALEEAREQHEGEVERLNNKNKELLGKIAKLRKDGGGDSADEIARLETELENTGKELGAAKSQLRTFERDLKKASEERDNAVKERDSERQLSQNELIENKLTAALVENKVAPHFMDAAKALLKGGATVEVDNDGNRTVKADGKDVAEFVKEWASGDAGKHYVQAPANGGGGATGPDGNGNPTGLKKLDEYTEAERRDMATNRPQEWQQVLAAAGQTQEQKPFTIAA